MTTVELPFVGTKVNTEKPGQGAQNVALAVLGVAGTFGVLAGGNWLYNRARSAAGVGADNDPIPGV